ncbi:FAR1 DNA-binding domain protein [Medicago truncatula]|uniref:FAR1 DNA-binding domain protein n=1 Tax=Medicago truncatula TaxID=3880 RepID=G7J2Y7_MEDTR|nr:FAR1 DNA-binding domain protein [Medicago truncatula]
MHQRTNTVENADDSGDRKPSGVDSVKVEAPMKVEASVKVETSSVNSDVCKLRDNEVDTDKDELLGWVRRQANRTEFTVIIRRSCEGRNGMLELVCERSGEYKLPKTKVKHEATGSRKCGCLFKVRGYVVRENNAWKLTILNGVHNHEMVRYAAGHLLTGRLMEDDKKIVHDLTDSSVKPKNILTNLKKKRKESITNIKQVYNERHKFKKVKEYLSTSKGTKMSLCTPGWGGHMSRQAMNFIFVEEARARKTLCIEKKTCGCVQRTSYGLPCACFIAMKIRHKKPIRLDEIHPHWHKLYMGEEESNEDLFSLAEEWRGIQEHLERVPFQMKLEIKEGMRLLAFPETTMLSPPPKKVPIKGAPKKIKTTRRIPSKWETIDSQHPKSQSSPRKKASQPKRKGARIDISPVPKPSLVSRNYDPSNPMYYMPKFMRPYIEGIVDVIGDGDCGFKAIAERVGLTEESHVMVRRALIKELKEHMNKYIEVYASADRYKYILDGLHPPKNLSSFAPPDKWLTLLDMGHIVASCYNRPVVEMTTLDIGVSETFFPT